MMRWSCIMCIIMSQLIVCQAATACHLSAQSGQSQSPGSASLSQMGLSPKSPSARSQPQPYPAVNASTARESVAPRLSSGGGAKAGQLVPAFTDLVEGETVLQSAHAQRIGSSQPHAHGGTLFVTNYRILWEAAQGRMVVHPTSQN